MTVKTTRDEIQQECLDELLKHYRCSTAMSMAVGKTRIAIKHLLKFYDPSLLVLVVIPKLSVKKAWIDELTKMGLHDELITHIKFTTYRSLINQDPNLYQIVYLDECHNILENHSKFLTLYQGKILGLTGTPPANEHSSKFKMMNKYFPIVYRFSIDEASDKNIINDYQIIIHEVSLSKDRNLKKNKKDGGHWYTSEFSDYQWLCEKIEEAGTFKQKQLSAVMRMKGLMNYSTKEKYTKNLLKNISAKCIVFANTTDQADQICPHSYHSKNLLSEQNLQLFTDGRINQLSCVLQLSEGATIPNLKVGIIMHAYGNEHKSSQRIGRLLRLNPLDTATCHILCYKNTVDATWIQDALKDFDQSKITYFNPLME